MTMMTLEQQVGEMMMAGFEGLEAPQHILDWLREGRIGGVILFARNVDTPAQVFHLTHSLREAARRPILIGIDQEGGTVARLRSGFTESPGAMAISACREDAEGYSERVSAVLGAEMRALGINWTFAPVLDITHDIRNASVGTRSYGSDRERVGLLATAAVRGFESAGVAACLKHFPGLGKSLVDTHVDLAVISGPLDDLYRTDMIPFRRVIQSGVASVMITHVKFDALDSENPATMAGAVVEGLLRDTLDYEALVTTDCMEMKAITRYFGSGEAAVRSVLAGIDVVLNSHTVEAQSAAYEAVLAAVQSGRIPLERINESNRRIAAMKARFAGEDPERPALSSIRSEAHLATMQAAARAGCVLIEEELNAKMQSGKDATQILPLPLGLGKRIVLIEFASAMDSEAMDVTGTTAFSSIVRERLPEISILSITPGAVPDAVGQAMLEQTRAADVVVIATCNAHLNPAQQALASDLLTEHGPKTILLCLRNPYDAGVLPARAFTLFTCGDATPSLEAAADALAGAFTPNGVLPVPIDVGLSPTS
jgi:beta-N-acetylhexosaminidase